MKITLHTGSSSQFQTECLVVAVVDASEKSTDGKNDKPKPQILSDDQAVLGAAADLLASGELTGKMLEVTLLHKPAGLKAKRLLLIGGNWSHLYLGVCALGACDGSYGNCDGNPANGCETDLRTTVTSCGACGRACAFAHAGSFKP